MMSGMTMYYASRAVFSIAFALLFAVTGMELWLAAVLGLVLFGLFLWAPRSGRYAVHPELGATALRRDERTQAINDKAARNAFVVTMLVAAAIVIYAQAAGMAAIPNAMVEGLVIVGFLVYFVSDWLLRRTSA